jgi:hypothetical protein
MGSVLHARNRFYGHGYKYKCSPLWIVEKTLKLVNTGRSPTPLIFYKNSPASSEGSPKAEKALM